MTRIPTSALILGLSGLIPFLWGGATSVTLLRDYLPGIALAPDLLGVPLLVAYGTIILCFMAGAIWGFVAKAEGPWLAIGLAISVLPALWILAFTGQPHATQLLALIAGFTALLPLDYLCARRAIAPGWWMPLRLVLTSVVVFCLAIGFLFAP